ncbi:endonuclease/exonuclease/phosphatase family protein [Streptomyces gobiensis]|uniref:endonuclease/exonuclease/phosphatase family protein n=1 Tax=Streptomyces gobiensis TaxID=2875706 RepID=UPI001E4D65ED|nr:endonuclease/exonuclease/phosphatase family protein [Streptomyces gobiensis]UGY94292.1 endonuclease/exonuclease/phosphatase family protein [Streptomyces gobiensis]
MYTGEDDHLTTSQPVREPARVPQRRRARHRRPLAWCAGLLLLPISLPLVARGLDTDGPAPLPQLLAFLPWFLIPGWLALLCAVLARQPLLLAWALAALGATAWYIQPYGSEQIIPEEPPLAQVRVLTANLEFGNATGGLLDVLRRERPHLVSVQECDHRCASALESQELREAYPYRLITGGSAAQGSALLSVYPLKDEREIPATLSMPSAVAEVGPNATPVRIQVAHPMPPRLDSMTAWNAELAALGKVAADRGDTRTVIAGDFNSSQDHATFRAILDTGLRDSARLLGHSRTPTWPALTAPPLGAQIDHILVSETLTPISSQFLDLPDTDHRALLVDVKVY